MLLIPLGPEKSTVRRLPWVCLGLLAANVVVFALTLLGGGDAAVEEAADRVVAYLEEHPYLEPPDAFADDEEFVEALEERRADHDRRRGRPVASALQEEQRHLDELGRAFQAALLARPTTRLGWVPARRDPVTMVTSMFVHAGWLHLIGNLLFLYVTGPFLEDVYGRVAFPALYAVSGLAALQAHTAHDPTSTVPLVGASGAIAGVMGAFLVRLGASRIHFLLLPFPVLPMIRVRLWLPAFVVLPLWFAEQVWYARQTEDASGVAWWAHVGGFLFGAAAALVMRLARFEERVVDPVVEGQIAITQHPGVEAALDARVAGNLAMARREIRRALKDQSDNLDAWAEAHEIERAAGDDDASARAAARLLELYVRGGETDMAVRFVREVRNGRPGALPVRFLASAAALLEKEGDARTALDLLDEIVSRAPEDPAAYRALIRRGTLLRKAGDAAGARDAFAAALRHRACSDAETLRRMIEQLG